MLMSNKFWLLVLTWLLTACQVLPERKPETTATVLPNTWLALSKQVPSEPVTQWLNSFDAPELNPLVNEALAHNKDLHAAAARVAQAKALVRKEEAARKPQLFANPTLNADHERNGAGVSVPFTLSWEWDVWGRISHLRDAAQFNAEALASDWQGARLSLAAATVTACFELAEARQRGHVAQVSITERRRLVALLRGRFDLGIADGLDLSLALTDLSDAEAELQLAYNDQHLALRRLQILLGTYPSGQQTQCQQLPDVPTMLPVGLPAQLLHRRPDILAAFARLQAADQHLAAANKARLPQIQLTASSGSAAEALANLSDPRVIAWNLALGLSQPLYAGGQLQADIDAQTAAVTESVAIYQQTVLEACAQVEQSLAAEQALLAQVQALTNVVAKTDTNRTLAIQAYRNGKADVLTLLDSYRNTLSSQTARLAAHLQALQNRVGLYLALGGDVTE